jgi:hypothetical protein
MSWLGNLKGRDQSEDLVINQEDNTRMDLREIELEGVG